MRVIDIGPGDEPAKFRGEVVGDGNHLVIETNMTATELVQLRRKIDELIVEMKQAESQAPS